MNNRAEKPGAILMIAYTNYQTDPRVIREAEAALSAGFEVDFLSLRRSGEAAVESIRGVRVIRLAQLRYRGGGLFSYALAYLQFFIRCFFKATFLHFRRHYRVVHVNNMPDFLVFSTLILKLTGCKVLLDIHDPMPNTFCSKFKSGEKGFFFKLLLWQERLSARYSDRVLTVSHPVKDFVLVKHGLPPESVEVIANFADDKVFGLRPSYNPDGKLRLIFHGTILERYGLRSLLEALSKVRNRSNMSVRIIGEGDFSKAFAQLIASFGLNDIIQFDNRVYPMHELPGIIDGSNLGLVPLEISSITNYALPLKMLEYISLGLPVITVRNAAIGYYFSETDCLFYQANDTESLRKALDHIADDRDLLLQYHKKAVALREKFLWTNEKAKYVNLLRQLTKQA